MTQEDQENLVQFLSEVDGVPLGSADIIEIENIFNCKLPEAYRIFLSSCGCGVVGKAYDTDFFYPAILDLRDEMEEMLLEDDRVDLWPDQTFVFAAYQGFEYFAFRCDGQPDPEILRVSDDPMLPRVHSESLARFLISLLSDPV